MRSELVFRVSSLGSVLHARVTHGCILVLLVVFTLTMAYGQTQAANKPEAATPTTGRERHPLSLRQVRSRGPRSQLGERAGIHPAPSTNNQFPNSYFDMVSALSIFSALTIFTLMT
jgi:hypothetical protein